MSPATTAREQYWKIRLETAQEALQSNNFAVTQMPTAQEAGRFVAEEMLKPNGVKLIGFSGSVSVLDSGVLDRIRADSSVTLLDSAAPGISQEERAELRRQALLSDLFLSSSNAVTMDGRLLNLDMVGNRVGPMHFGPRKVILFVGRNKLCENLDQARTRIRDYASPMNVMRIGYKNPCIKTGRCMDCKSPERICNVWTVTEKCFPAQRIHIMLINEDAGY